MDCARARRSRRHSKHVKTYFMVFGALMVLTVITVGVRICTATPQAIIVALIIATIKGSLVALFFMHLKHERKLIYSALDADGGLFHVPDVRSAATNSDKIPGRRGKIWSTMSLKWFHIVFICSRVCRCGWRLGAVRWADHLALGVASLGRRWDLCVYGNYVPWRRLRKRGV